MDLRLRLLAWLHIVLGALGIAPLLILVASYAMANDPAYDAAFAWIGGLLFLASLVYFMPMLIAGIGILKGIPWARTLLWAVSALLAAAVPIGTALAGLNLWVLISTRQETADGGMAKFEAYMRRLLPLLGAALVALFLLGVIVLVGYLFRDVIDPPREQILTPLPSFPPPSVDRPDFRMPDLNPPQPPPAPEP